jgi:hypothetical protein
MTLTFSDGNCVTFAYTTDRASQRMAITRQVVNAPGTACFLGCAIG